MRIMVAGLRGFPHVQGGVETHCEELYPRLVELGCEVEVIIRSNYMNHFPHDDYQGVRFVRLPAIKLAGLEAILHTLFAVLYAGIRRPDLLHIHAIGPAIFAPLARLLGLKVVITHHGFDYDREKWGGGASKILRLGERLGIRFSNERIVVASYIRESILQRMGRESAVIPNGVNVFTRSDATEVIDGLGLSSQRYILHVGRLVPEKRQLKLIEAFIEAKLPGWKLVLVGSLEPKSEYIQSVQQAASHCPSILLTGFQTGESLRQLYSHAGLFVLPSTHEGLPISLLEALSYGLPVLVSDIPAHREVALDGDEYIPVDGKPELIDALQKHVGKVWSDSIRVIQQAKISERFQWERVAKATLDVYKRVLPT